MACQSLKVCGNTFEYPLQRDIFIDYFVKNAGADKNRLCYKWIDTISGAACGMISYSRIDWTNDYGHIGFTAIDPNLRYQGIGTSMIEATLNLGFNLYNFNRIDIVVIEKNTKAYRLYVNKIGFVNEGLIRNIIKVNDNYMSWYSLSLLKKEWLQKKRPTICQLMNG